MALSGFELNENKSLNTNNNLINAYLESIENGELRHDPAQEQVIHELQSIYNAVLDKKTNSSSNKSLFSFFTNRSKKPETSIIKGLYLYGGVGRGKTHLVDFFFDRLPIEKIVLIKE